MMKSRRHVLLFRLEHSSFFLGILKEASAVAIKQAVACQIQRAMEREKISKVEMARQMKTSRAALDRLFAPGNASVTLQTLTRAARAIGRDLRIELI